MVSKNGQETEHHLVRSSASSKIFIHSLERITQIFSFSQSRHHCIEAGTLPQQKVSVARSFKWLRPTETDLLTILHCNDVGFLINRPAKEDSVWKLLVSKVCLICDSHVLDRQTTRIYTQSKRGVFISTVP